MKTRPFTLIALALILSTCSAVFVRAQKEPDSTFARVADYRQWARVTREPVPIPVPETVTTDIASGGG